MEFSQTLSLPEFGIVDMHLHLPVASDDWLAPWRVRFIEENGADRYQELQLSRTGQPSWLPEFSFPEPDPPFEDSCEAADRWAAECERYPIDRVVFLTGGGNETLADAIAAHPHRFFGFAHHSIDEPDAAQQLEKALDELGLIGLKIMAPLLDKPLWDRAYDDVFEICHQRRLPVLIHFGILGGGGSCAIVSGPNLSPLALADTAQRFPHVRFVVPHFGCGFPDDLLQLCWANPNVSVDTSGNNLWTKWTMQRFTLEQLFSRFAATIGPKRILFGSDSEWFPRGFALPYLTDQLRAARGIGMSEDDIRCIFRENALEWLNL